MRLQRITTSYPIYVEQFYDRRPGLVNQPYAVQHSALLEDSSDWADFWSVALGKLGYEAVDVFSSMKPMQQRWAREHETVFDEANWLLEITAAQVKAFKPEVLFVVDYVTFTAPFLRRLKAECPSIRLVLGWCGGPYSDASVFREYDLILSSVPELARDFLDQGHRCHHINHAFDPRVLERINTSGPPDVDFAFIGSVFKRNRYHTSREALLLDLVEHTNLQIWTDVTTASFEERSGVRLRQMAYDTVQKAKRMGVSDAVLTAIPVIGKAARWESRPTIPETIEELITRRARPPLFGLEMFQKLQRSRISLNMHIDISPTHASNMRLYEATGAGSCLLTDWKANLRELFEPDAEVVAYRSAEECAEKVKYLLEHEDERRNIARAGQARTLRSHTFDHRAAQLDELIRQALA
ncbi:MAG: glycosyltransferase [Pyrinomonadaceae bacterium]